MIRPFQLGDIFLIQRLGRQAANLNTIQVLLQPQSTTWASLSTIVPWNDAKITTYVLRQQGNRLAGVGLLQVQKRPGRPELDIICLAPGLDTPLGHPAIWEKLLSHHNQEATKQQVARIYVDVPDQPLPVSSFTHVGFRPYARQTVWRLTSQTADALSPQVISNRVTADIRQQTKQDEWALTRLYRRIVPEKVQIAQGMRTPETEDGAELRPPLLDWWLPGNCSDYVLEKRGDIRGSIQMVEGRRGFWLQLWADLLNPDTTVVHQLLQHGLRMVSQRSTRQPVYIAVADYQGGLSHILPDYGFAPFTDRTKMVKHVVAWARHKIHAQAMVLEPAVNVAPVQFHTGRDRSRLVRRGSVTLPQLCPDSVQTELDVRSGRGIMGSWARDQVQHSNPM